LIHNDMPCDPIQVQDRRGPKAAKMADFKFIGTHVIKRQR